MVYGYIRVSTDRQTVENQRFEILRFCKKNSLEVGAWIEETISGTITPDKRELGRLLSHIRKDDLIIIHYITNNQNNHVPQNFLIKFASRANAL